MLSVQQLYTGVLMTMLRQFVALQEYRYLLVLYTP